MEIIVGITGATGVIYGVRLVEILKNIENMMKLSKIGVRILPPMPAFYNNPSTIDDIILQLIYFRQKKYNKIMEVLCVDYITTKEAAKNWGITDRMVVYYCSAGRIRGAKKIGNTWLVPDNAEKPADGRYKTGKAKDDENK